VSYNKVQTPFTIRTRATRQNIADRAAFLQDCEDKLDSLELYKFVTPERVYNDVNLVMVDYHRNSREGYSILAVDFVLREVRINKDSRYEKGKNPSAASQQSGGQRVAK
jgi:hypothetical protein